MMYIQARRIACAKLCTDEAEKLHTSKKFGFT